VAWPVCDALTLQFSLLDGRGIRVQENEVEFGHRDQGEEVAQDGADERDLTRLWRAVGRAGPALL
jgi:hypothetical protein